MFVQFIREKDRVWRAAHVIIDCKLSTGEMNFEYVVDFLMKHVNMEKVSAIAEVKHYKQTPTYQLSYRIGRHLIKKLKEEGKNKMRERFLEYFLCFFHDTLLKEGNMSLYYLIKIF